ENQEGCSDGEEALGQHTWDHVPRVPSVFSPCKARNISSVSPRTLRHSRDIGRFILQACTPSTPVNSLINYWTLFQSIWRHSSNPLIGDKLRLSSEAKTILF